MNPALCRGYMHFRKLADIIAAEGIRAGIAYDAKVTLERARARHERGKQRESAYMQRASNIVTESIRLYFAPVVYVQGVLEPDPYPVEE